MYNIKPIYVKKVKDLAKIPFEKLKRKFFIGGREQMGKTKTIQSLYDQISKIEYEEQPNLLKYVNTAHLMLRDPLLSSHGNLGLDPIRIMPKPKIEYAKDPVKVAGFKTGHLEHMNIFDAYGDTSKVPFELIEKLEAKLRLKPPTYGIKTLDGSRQAPFIDSDDSPFWEIAYE